MALDSGHRREGSMVRDSDNYRILRIAGGAPGLDVGDKMDTGDVRDADGYEKVRISSASPGGVGVELGYAQSISDFSTGSTSLVDVPGLTTTVTVASRPIVVEFFCAGANNPTSGGAVTLSIVEDAGSVGLAQTLFAVDTNAKVPVHLKSRRTPAAGSHTYKIQMSVSSGTGTLTAASGSFLLPMFIQVLQV